MRAAVRHHYGSPDDVQSVELPTPQIADAEVLVRVRAVSLNASDWEYLTGSPSYVRMWGLKRPRHQVLGSDVAGRVEAIGRAVSRFRVGDEVFGDILGRFGGLAEYVSAPEKALLHKPAELSFEQAAALPQAGLLAWQALRAKGRLRAGQSVLINGAGGGAGSFAVQIAKSLGATVTGVDSAAKLAFMHALGADHTLDYARDDFTRQSTRHDLILDLVARHSLLDVRRALLPQGAYVMVGGTMKQLLAAAAFGPLLSLTGPKMGLLALEANRGLSELAEEVQAGRLKVTIDRVFPLAAAAEALRYLGEGHALGKVVVTV